MQLQNNYNNMGYVKGESEMVRLYYVNKYAEGAQTLS